MHQTTVRFSPDVWRMLEAEAASCCVSIAQYVREATLARIAFTAGQRSADGRGDAFAWADPASTRADPAQQGGRGHGQTSTATSGPIATARGRAARS